MTDNDRPEQAAPRLTERERMAAFRELVCGSAE